MALARVVTFDGVSKDRIEELEREIGQGEPPEGVPATEILVLHDAEAEKSLVVVFFDTDDDYRQGDEGLNAMQTDDTPGQRTSVTKYDVAVRMTSNPKRGRPTPTSSARRRSSVHPPVDVVAVVGARDAAWIARPHPRAWNRNPPEAGATSKRSNDRRVSTGGSPPDRPRGNNVHGSPPRQWRRSSRAGPSAARSTPATSRCTTSHGVAAYPDARG